MKTKPVMESQSGYSGGPIWPYPNPGVQPGPTAVYYEPGPIRAQFVQPYPAGPVKLPVGFPVVGQMYGSGTGYG